MLEFLVDNIFVVFGGKVFKQIVRIPVGTNCAPLLADIHLCLYWYEVEFIQSLLSARKEKLASQFNFTYRYIDDVLSINNQDFQNYIGQIYPTELEIKYKTDSNFSASYLDLVLSVGRDGQLRISLYEHDDFNFHITNSHFLSRNIPKPMMCLSHISYCIPGIAPLMNVLFWVRRDSHATSRAGICQGTFEIVPQEVLLSI